MKLTKSILLAFFPFLMFGQITESEVIKMVNEAPEPQLIVENSRMLQENYYYFAGIIADKLVSLKPDNANYNYRKGFIVLDTELDGAKAIPYLEKAVTKISKNYDMYGPKEDGAPADAYYHLGRAYHLDEQLDKAVQSYTKFLELSNKKSVLVDKANLRIIQCEIARQQMDNPKSALVKNLGKTINTDLPEYSPVISLDGQSLYFTTRKEWEDGSSSEEFRDPMFYDYPEDVYVSYMDMDREWTTPYKLEMNTTNGNEATIAISKDERRVYVYQDVSGGGDIYYSDIKGNEFQTLEQLEYDGVNTKYWETHCTVTPDGQNMYFVSERPGGFGGRDIYRVVKLPNGTWSEPMNLGPTINTKYDEESPFLAVDNKTMYFASNGPKSMGGFDIFVSFRDENNQWTEPVNLGYPINSTGDDLFYTTTFDGLRGYLTSYRKGGYGEKDIYEIQNDYLGVENIITLRGAIYNIDGSPIDETAYISVKCLTCESAYSEALLPRLRDGAFITTLIPCKDYEIVFFENTDKEIRREKFSTACSGNQEIYREAFIGNYTLLVNVLDNSTGNLLDSATVKIFDATGKNLLATASSSEVGRYRYDLPESFKFSDSVAYQVQVSKKGYITQTFELTEKLGMKPVFEKTVPLEPATIGADLAKVFHLNPIYYDLDKSNIRPDAALELDKIVKIMNENPTMVVELGSHTDCRASATYNMSLSSRRAKSAAEYIQKRISNPKRISGKGYGESMLVNDCGCEGDVVSDCSEEEHQANRRTEFKIVKQ